MKIYVFLILTLACFFSAACERSTETFISPVARYGRIQIADATINGIKLRQLSDERGNPIQFRGLSTSGLQWQEGNWVLSDEVFATLAMDWKIDVIRLAMYITEEGYADKPAEMLAQVELGIELATKYGLYVIVDWHTLTPINPFAPEYLEAGKDLPQYTEIRAKHPEYTGPQLFFAYLSQKYGHLPNVIWEIANETAIIDTGSHPKESWDTILLPYMQSVLAAIREYDADKHDNIVICSVDRSIYFINVPVGNTVQDRNGQIMYSLHFYAGVYAHPVYKLGKSTVENSMEEALKGGMALFSTEWGTSDMSGDDGHYFEEAEEWLAFLNKYKISWCIWSLVRKSETSSVLLPTTPDKPSFKKGDGIAKWNPKTELSATGRFIREKTRNRE